MAIFYRSEIVLAILVEDKLSNSLIKFECNWLRGIGEVGVFRFFYFSSDGHLLYGSGTVLAILVEDNLSNIPLKFQ